MDHNDAYRMVVAHGIVRGPLETTRPGKWVINGLFRCWFVSNYGRREEGVLTAWRFTESTKSTETEQLIEQIRQEITSKIVDITNGACATTAVVFKPHEICPYVQFNEAVVISRRKQKLLTATNTKERK